MKSLLILVMVIFSILSTKAQSHYYTLGIGSEQTLSINVQPSPNCFISSYHWQFPGKNIFVMDDEGQPDTCRTIKVLRGQESVSNQVEVKCFWRQKIAGGNTEIPGGTVTFYITAKPEEDVNKEAAILNFVESSIKDGSTDVPTDIKIELLFNHALKDNISENLPQEHWYRLEADDGTKVFLDAKFHNKVAPSGNEECKIVFTPQQPLMHGTYYSFIMPEGCIKTKAGISNSNALKINFITASESAELSVPLTVSNLYPEDGATGIETNVIPCITFSEDIELTNSKFTKANKRIALYDDESREIALKDDIQINGNTLSISPMLALCKGTKYTLVIGAGQIRKKGIKIVNDNDIIVNFTTIEGTNNPPMTIFGVSPKNNSQGVATNVTPLVEFTDPVIIAPNSNITLCDFEGTIVPTDQICMQGNTLLIEPTNILNPSTSYMLYIPSNSLVDPCTAAYVDEDFKFSFITKALDGDDYPLLDLTCSVSSPEVTDGIWTSSELNFHIDIDNPTNIIFKGKIGYQQYFTEALIPGFSAWPSDNKYIFPGKNHLIVKEGGGTATPAKFELFFYSPDYYGEKLSLGTLYIRKHETTSIGNILKEYSTPTIYNLGGQKLSYPQKGINIINGKKVVIK